MHVLDVASLGYVMRKQCDGPASAWQNPGVLRFGEYCELLNLGDYDVPSRQAAKPLCSTDPSKLNDRLRELGGYADYDTLGGRRGVVTAMDARVKFAEGCSRFIVDQHNGNLAVAAPAAQIFDVQGEHGTEQITVIYTDDNGFLLLVPCQDLKDDRSMLRRARWAMAKVGEAAIAASKPSAGSKSDAKAGYGGKSGAGDHWQGVVFPAPSGTFWRQIDWMRGGANANGVQIHSVHQKFSLAFDNVPAVQPSHTSSPLDECVDLSKTSFILGKAMPTPSLEAADFPFRVEWVVQPDAVA